MFFIALAAIFVAAVWLRVRSYDPAVLKTASITPDGTSAVPRRGTSSPMPETGTIVDVGTTGSAAPGSAAAVSARQRRYEELLRSGPPPAAPVAPAPPKDDRTLFQRVVTPITNALGMTRAKPVAPAPAPAPAAASSSSSRGSTPQQPYPGRTTENDGGSSGSEDDPETDIIPPQLLTAEFAPPQVRDGEETIFAAVVNDNLSGVRSVSGVITSPSGSLQGFACTREGDTNRFVARVNVPRDAAEGVWVVKYLTLADNAGNTINLNAGTGALPASASFRVVSSASDATGPQLKGVWLERPAMRAGEKNTVFVQAEDDKAGVSLVSGVFVSPSKVARVGFGCRLGSGGVWECALTPPACLDCGVWRLEQIQLQDKANNLTTFRADNQFVGTAVVDITSDRCDAIPPVVTQLTIDPPVVSNAQAAVLQIRAKAFDEGGCGTASLSGQAIPPGGQGGQRQYFSFRQAGDGETFVGEIRIPQFAAKGQWTIAWIQALDNGMNLRAYSAGEPVVARATFRVE